MRIQLLFSVIGMTLSACVFGQLPRIILEPADGGEPQVFQDFDLALESAEASDRLYLSGGAFQSSQQLTIAFR